MTTYRPFINTLTIITMLVMVFGVVDLAQAVSPPNLVTYQGRVLDANGVPVSSSSVSMSFAFYSALTGGTCLWSNASATCATTTARTVTLTSGLFTENLGDTAASTPYAAIADTVFANNASVYLEVVIAGETLTPRKQLVAAPYAMNAETLDGVELATIQLWEVGTSGSYEDDVAAIVGADAAFSYGSGGVGDLRVADQLEVMDDGYIDNDLVVGASTSATETITNAGFLLNGNDLFVASELGVEGHIYTDGSIFAVGLVSAASFVCTDCIDFTEIDDDLGLDASTSIIQDSAETFTITNSGTGNTIIDLASTGDFVIQDNGSTFFTLSDAGALTLTLDATDNPAFTVTNSGTSNVTYNLASTGDFIIQDNGVAAFTLNDSGNAVLSGDIAVNGDDITSDGNLSVSATGYTRVGDSGTPGSATADDALYVEGAFEVDGATTLDGILTSNGSATFNTDVDVTLAGAENVAITHDAGASANVLSVAVTPSATAGTVYGAYIAQANGANTNGIDIGVLVENLDTDLAIADAFAVSSVAGTVTDAFDGGGSNITNALSAFDNFILMNATRMFEGSSGVITWEDTSGNDLMTLTDAGTTGNLAVTGTLAVTGNTTLTGDLAVNGDDITSDGVLTITASTYTRIGDVSTPGDASTDDDLYVSGAFEVDGTAFFDGSVDFDGAVDMDSTLNVDGAATFTSTLSASAGQISLTPTQTIASAAGATWNGLTVPATTATITGATGITTATGFNLVNISQPTLSAASALTVTNAASLYIANAPTGGGVGPAAITNAYALWVDAGASRFDGAVTAGATLAVTGDTTLTGDLAVNGDDITSDGTLTIDSSGTIQLGTDDDLLPQLGAADADLGATTSRWDNVYAVAGSFSGTATVGDLSCTDCIDFAEMVDAMALDTSTSIAQDAAETFTISNGGTGNTIVNLTSTGDFVIQDSGIAVFTLDDTGDSTFTLAASGNVVIDAASTDHTSLTGALDINFDTSTTLAQGANLTLTAIDDDAADTITGFYIDATIQDDTTATDTVYGHYINITNSDTNAAGTGLLIEADDDGVGVVSSGITISNQQATDIDLTDGVLVLATTDGSLVDAFDASDAEITNALSVGPNSIVGTTGAITYTGATTWSSTGGDVTILANVEGADLLLGGGDTLQATLTGGNDLEIRAEDDFFVNVTDDTTFRLQAAGDVIVDASTNARTETGGGAIDINVSTVGGSGLGNFVRGLTIDATITDNNAANNLSGADLTISSSSDDGDTLYGMTITKREPGASAADQDVTAGILIVNADLTAADDFTAGILFDDASGGGYTYGIDFNGATIDTADIRLENGETIANGTDGTVDITGQLEITLDGTAVTDEAICAGTVAGGEGTDGDAADQTDILVSDCSGSPTGDYAEQYPVASGITFGDIVVPGTKVVTTVDGQTIVQLVKSSQPYSGPVAGIVSDNYGDFTSAGYNIPASENPMPVALVGRVPVNATNENGSIKVGDYLTTSSTPGYAMKATKVGRVIGMALADFDGTTGQVMVQVNNGWYLGDVIATDGSSTIVSDKVVVAPLRSASASESSVESYGFALRGSAWNGAQAQAVEMLLKTSVMDTNNFRLSVRNTTDTEVAYITNTGTMQISGDMVITGKLYPSDRGVAQTDKYIYYDGSSGAGGDFMRTNAKGWSTGSYDFAEMFPSDDTLQAGEVVVFGESGEKVARSMEASSPRIAGIVSTRPGFLAGDNIIGSHPIALAGRVPTRVTSENGEVKVGDPLTTSSKPGYAMKATEAGMIVGYALEPVVSGDTSILVYVNVGYWGGEATSTTPGANNQASGFASGTNVNYSALNMTGNIYVSGNEILSVGRIAGIGDVWSIDQDGTMKTEGLLKTVTRSYTDEKVETIAVTSPEAVITLTGTSQLSGGQAEVRFEDFAPSFNDVTAADASLRVIVTPSGPVSLYVFEKDNNHFVVKQFAGESADVEFDWMVTAYRKGYEPVPVDSAPPVSPDINIIDQVTEDEGGEIAEQPSESVIEPSQSESETTPSEEISSVQEAAAESGT